MLDAYERGLEVGAAASVFHAHGRGRHARRHDLALHHRPEGPAAAAGHRADPRRDRRRAIDLLHGHGAAASARSPRSCAGSGRGERRLVRRRRHGQRHGQHRPALHRAQAARPAQGRARREIIDRLREATAGRGGHLALHAGRAGCADRQPRQPHAVPIHAAGCRRGGAGRMGAEAARQAARRCPNWPMWPAISRSSGLQLSVDIDREQAARFNVLTAGHRRHALRRLRPAAGLDHLHPAQPVPRHPGGRAALPAHAGCRSTRST